MDSSASYSDTLIYLYRYIAIPLYILGNLGQVFSALIFLKKAWRKNVCVFYFLICLLFNFIYMNSAMLGSIFIYGFKINLNNSNIILCKLYNYITFFFTTFPSTILVLASIDRLLISSQNTETRLYSSRRLAYFSLSISTCFWLIFFIHVLIKFNIQQFGPFVFVCAYDLNGFYSIFLPNSVLISNLVSFLIMIILSILSFKNVRRIRLIPRQQRKDIRSMRKKDFQLLRCLFTQDIVYLLGSILLIGQTIYGTIINNQSQTSSTQVLKMFLLNLGIFIHHMPFCLSFFIYVSISKAFRQEFKHLIYKICGQNLQVTQGEEDNTKQNNAELNVVTASVLPA